MPVKNLSKIGKDLRLGEILAGPNPNIVFKCTNPNDTWTEREYHAYVIGGICGAHPRC